MKQTLAKGFGGKFQAQEWKPEPSCRTRVAPEVPQHCPQGGGSATSRTAAPQGSPGAIPACGRLSGAAR